MNKDDVLKKFNEGFDCSQIVLSKFSDKLGISKEDALKIAACFGGGMWHGETCGCVVGGLIALGIKYATIKPNDMETKNKLLELKNKYETEFCKKHGSCICKEILGYDLSNSDDMKKIQEEKLLEEKCPQVVIDACNILDKLV